MTNGIKGAREPSLAVLRVAAVAALILAVSGCVSPAAAPVNDVDEAPADDGLRVTATRVEPLVHTVDETGRIANHACTTDEQDCNDPTSIGAVAGYQADMPVRDFGDPLALFWRVSLHADWSSKGLPNGMVMTIYATTPCGIGCIKAREVTSDATGTSPGFDSLDVYLNPGETGVRVRLDVEETTTVWGAAGIDYHLHGTVGGYRAVGPPILLA